MHIHLDLKKIINIDPRSVMVFTEVASTYKDTTAGDVILNDNYSKIYEGKK